MVRFVGLGLLVAGCVATSDPVGTVEQQGSSSSSTGEGAAQCPEDSPPLGCPYNGNFGACGESPTSEVDESCCRRPFCETNADCPDGLVCNLGGLHGFGCEESVIEGEVMCICGADPLAIGRPMCIPPSSVDPDWCAQLRTEQECDGSEPVDFGEDDVRFCRWVPAHEVRLEGDACTIEEALPRCMTLRQPDGNGCSPAPCMLDGRELLGALARPLDPSSYELVIAGEVLCGVGTPLDDWIPADDPSLGPCALDCGG